MAAETLSQTAQAAALSTLSNVIAQVLAAYKAEKPIWVLRSGPLARQVAYSVLTTPPNVFWQQYLEHRFPGDGSNGAKGKLASQSNTNLVAKFVLDQSVGAIFNILLFICLMGLMEGESLGEIKQSVVRDSIPIYTSGLMLWPLVSLISFAALPVEQRVLFGSVAGVLWGVYLSLMALKN